MIQVDISNVWGAFSLQEFLKMEQVVFSAHSAVMRRSEEESSRWDIPPAAEEWEAIRALSRKIRENFDICVVVGSDEQTLTARAVMTLLQGSERNFRMKPALLFTGHSFSSTHFQELSKTLEGKDFCILAVSGSEPEPQAALTLRSLRWMLERKYGCENAKGRIFAVAGSEMHPLHQMAQQARWECLVSGSGQGVLSAQTMVLLETAGIAAQTVAAGAEEARKALDLRSFENPAWLYAAAKTLLAEKGKSAEILEFSQPDFALFGRKWQQLFSGPTVPILAEFPSLTKSMERCLSLGTGFVTRVQFAMPANPVRIVPDLQDCDGLNYLADVPVDLVAKQSMDAMAQVYQDWGVSLIGIDCDTENEKTAGELAYFMELSGKLYAEIPLENQQDLPHIPSLPETILQLFGDGGRASAKRE